MINLVAVGAAGGGILEAAASLDLARGAIAGAFFVAAAFLTGYMLIRRSRVAAGALVLVIAAGALQLNALGLISVVGDNATILLQGLFAAAAIIFLSMTINIARRNALLGGVMFTAALVIAGIGVINFSDRVDIAPLMRYAMLGVGGFSIALAASQAWRGDAGAQMILPGAVLVVAAPLIGPLIAAESSLLAAAPHGLFTLGVLAASLVALTESRPRSVTAMSPIAETPAIMSEFKRDRRDAERNEIVIDSQIARVLDYAGIATWDWSEDAIEQTSSLPEILGADSKAPFTPDALREFIHETDLPVFEKEIAGPTDGAFDVRLKLFDGRTVRVRGARATNPSSKELERVVAFVERADGLGRGLAAMNADVDNGVSQSGVRKATEAAVVPTAAMMAAGAKFSAALEKGDIVAAFQPIVTLESEKIAGYEALARWRDQDDGADEGPEVFVKTAEAAGQGDVLTQIMLDAASAFLAEKIKSEKRKGLFVTLNVSFGQMRATGFVDKVRSVIEKHQLPDSALVLELTESDAVSDIAAAGKIFRSLKSAGAALAFDDFGAGFSCLSNLHKFDFDYIKIDKSFIADLERGGDKSKIVRALAGLGKDLGMKVIAEGVETKDAASAARNIGCSYAQGYLFGKAVEIGPPSASNDKPTSNGKKTMVDAKSKHDVDTPELSFDEQADGDRKENRWRPWRGDLR